MNLIRASNEAASGGGETCFTPQNNGQRDMTMNSQMTEGEYGTPMSHRF